jgi:hypothetical protein
MNSTEQAKEKVTIYVPAETWKQIRVLCATEDMTHSDYLTGLMQRDLRHRAEAAGAVGDRSEGVK